MGSDAGSASSGEDFTGEISDRGSALTQGGRSTFGGESAPARVFRSNTTIPVRVPPGEAVIVENAGAEAEYRVVYEVLSQRMS